MRSNIGGLAGVLSVCAALGLSSCSQVAQLGVPQVRQVSSETACVDAMGFTMVAMSVAFGDQQTWDVARSQANSLLEERATDEQVTTAVHRLANSTIDLVTAMEAIASDPNANTGLLGTGTQALDAMGEPLAQVQKAVDEIGSVCK